MKCTAIALLATGAYAIKDTTPPVMSVSLDGTVINHAYSHTCNVCTTAATENWCSGDWTPTTTDAYCIDPVCSVSDHHDQALSCEISVSAINIDGHVGSEASDYYHPTTGAVDAWGVGGNWGQFASEDALMNDANHVLDAAHTTCVPENDFENTANRKLRSLWMYTYNARDASDNAADTVSFALTMVDHTPPAMVIHDVALSTNLGTTNEKESCANGPDVGTLDFDADTQRATAAASAMDPATHPTGNPCTLIGSTASLTASDNYDPDNFDCRDSITPNIQVKVDESETEPSNWASDACWKVGNEALGRAACTNDELTINTQGVSGASNWYIHYSVCDNAGQFGVSGADNCDSDDVVHIQTADTTAPVVVLNPRTDDLGVGPDYTLAAHNSKGDDYECSLTDKEFHEAGAQCRDAVQAWSGSNYAWVSATVSGDDVDDDAAGAYSVTYTCTDGVNPAQTATRAVRVVDTTNPVLTLIGDTLIQESTGVSVQGNINAAGTETGAVQHCDEQYTNGSEDYDNCIAQYGFESASGFDAVALQQAYTCTDTCGSAEVVTVVTLHQGFGCDGDQIGSDDDLSSFPEYTTGEYSIKYHCYDGAVKFDDTYPSWREDMVVTPAQGTAGRIGNNVHACRNIQNVDHTHPTIQILGSNDMILEATHEGNYIDDGATCSDEVDGVISQNVEVSGDVVNLSKVGTYTITYNCKDSAGNAAPSISRTVHVKQTSCPTCDFGDGAETEVNHEASFTYTDAPPMCTDTIDGTVSTVTTVTDSEDAVTDFSAMVATTGTYKVTYTAKNSVGLWNDGTNTAGEDVGCRGTANHYIRTIHVLDTLKPVITLDVNGEQVKGHGGEESSGDTRPLDVDPTSATYGQSGDLFTNPIEGAEALMAEKTSRGANAWVLGAVASAVTGLALLGFSQRKTTVATSVPV
jgi:hypothetical protein